MGRVVKREIVGIRCELATPKGRWKPSCWAVETVWPVPADAGWEDQVRELARLVESGWALVLLPMLRSYCPDHAERASLCSCRTNPQRQHLCAVHSEAKDLIWTRDRVPAEVSRELDRNGVKA